MCNENITIIVENTVDSTDLHVTSEETNISLEVTEANTDVSVLVVEQINEVSEMISADLIVMGTNGTQGGSKKFIGSNAEKVVRLSKCPVITIKGKEHRDGCENIILPLDFLIFNVNADNNSFIYGFGTNRCQPYARPRCVC